MIEFYLNEWLEHEALTNKLVVAFSGGLDSTVLLYALSKLNVKLRAIHINHGLSSNALAWEQHCINVCASLAIPVTVVQLKLARKKRQSLEAVARDARYAAFKASLKPGEALVTAHHRDDQIETFWLNLLRGSSVHGLAAMPTCRPLVTGQDVVLNYLYRPLLRVSRSDIKAYAQQHQLVWVEDESNLNPDFMRNKLRHEVLPLLDTLLPQLKDAIVKSSALCAQNAELQRMVAREDLQGDEHAKSIDLTTFLNLSDVRQINALRYWMHVITGSFPPEAKLVEYLRQINTSGSDAKPKLKFKGFCFERTKEALKAYQEIASGENYQDFALRLLELAPNTSFSVPLGNDVLLVVSKVRGQGLYIPKNEVKKLIIKKRSGGEKCEALTINKKLKKILQEQKIEQRVRDSVPLIYSGEKLICVPTIFNHAKYWVTNENEYGWCFELRPI